MNRAPFISVITPSLNRANLIGTAIESVLIQHYEPYEHIVMDGGSTDGTLDLLKAHAHLRVVSEPDHGLYDALNKGIALARGEIIGQLNSDDRYEPGIFSSIAELFAQNPEVDAVSGGARVFERHATGEQTIKEYDGMTMNELPYRATFGIPVFNAWFFRKRFLERIGPYSLEYPLLADRDFLIRCYLNKIKVMPLHSVVYHYFQHSGSLTIHSRRDLSPSHRTEILQLAQKYMHSKSSDFVVKKNCAEWYDSNAIELVITLVRQRQSIPALKVVWSASRQNPKWPFVVIMQSPGRVWSYIRKKHNANL